MNQALLSRSGNGFVRTSDQRLKFASKRGHLGGRGSAPRTARPFDGDLGLNAGQRSPVRGGEPQGVFRDLRASWTLRWTLPRKIERRRFVPCEPPHRDCKQGNNDERTQQRLRDEHRATVSCLRLRVRLKSAYRSRSSLVRYSAIKDLLPK